jgi:hypothetical protein
MPHQISATYRDVQEVIKLLHLKTNSNFLTTLMLPILFPIGECKTWWMNLTHEFL